MLIDFHAHLDHYGDNLDRALAEIEAYRILTVAVGMDPESSEKSRKIADRSSLVIPAVGVHPWNAPSYARRLEEIIPLIPRFPMIGEVGLDFHFVEDRSAYPAQREILDFFLSAAREHRCIVNLHTKGAEREVLDMLIHHDVHRGIVHWYSGPPHLMGGYFDRGFMFTVGVEILVSDDIARIAAQIPDDLLLTETDNPGGYEWYAKVWGMPSLLTQVIEKLAATRNTSPAKIEETVRANVARIIGEDRRLIKWARLLRRDSGDK